MDVVTRGRFAKDRIAVAVMVDLALLSQHGPVALEQISQRQRLSPYGLEVLFTQLRRHKLVRFTRGREGGYEPARRPCDITVAEVVQCVKEPPDRRSTFSAEGRVGDNAGKCLTQELWVGLEEVVAGVLGAVTLQDLIDQRADAAEGEREVPAPVAVVPLPPVLVRSPALPRHGGAPKAVLPVPPRRGEAVARAALSESLA